MSGKSSIVGIADAVFYRGRIWTGEARHPRAEALAALNGRIVAVGSSDDVRALAGPATRVVDLADRTVVPGFIDAHTHFQSTGVQQIQAVDCAVPSIPDVQQALRERAAQTPEGGWVRGFHFDDTKIAELRHLASADLDAVTTRHGVYVAHQGGHRYYVNRMGLHLAGITKDTPDPPDGHFERDPRSGEPTGILFEGAGRMIRALFPAPTRAERLEGLRQVMRMFHRVGLTSVHDAVVTPDDLRIYLEAHLAGELSLRTYMLVEYPALDAVIASGLRSGFGDEMLRLGGIKFFTDGAIAGRTAWLKEPYEGSQDRGVLAHTAESLIGGMRRAHRAGFQLCTHANGDAAIEMLLDLYEAVLGEDPRPDARPRIEHCTVVNDGILKRMKKLGAVATPFCTYVYYHGEKMKYYGEARLERMFAQRSFLDHGIVSTGATDYECGPCEPLLGIQTCVTRTDSSGHVWGASQRVSVEEALRLYTHNGAYASFEERIKGTLAPGKLADFVVLGADPLQVDPLAIKDIPVEMTVVGGNAVYDAGA